MYTLPRASNTLATPLTASKQQIHLLDLVVDFKKVIALFLLNLKRTRCNTQKMPTLRLKFASVSGVLSEFRYRDGKTSTQTNSSRLESRVGRGEGVEAALRDLRMGSGGPS